MNKCIKIFYIVLLIVPILSGNALGSPAPPPPVVVSTLACTDPDGQAATFENPTAVTADGNGNLYVIDCNAIWKITPERVRSILAGSPDGEPGYGNGQGKEARFDNPAGIVADKKGNLFVTDTSNNVIRKIEPNGMVSTLACIDGLSGEEAVFENLVGITLDAGGNLYVTANQIVQKITPDGKVATLAGAKGLPGSFDGPSWKAKFNYPSGIVADNSGNLYVADTKNNAVRKITPDGNVTTLAGKAGKKGWNDGVGAQARFYFPWGITMAPSENLYVTDTRNHLIRKITPDGTVATLAGKPGKTGSDDGTEARFGFPMDITMMNGDLYVADTNNFLIRKIVLP